jgi:hypothetical protein
MPQGPGTYDKPGRPKKSSGFTMKGWSPFTQKPKTTSTKDQDLYEGGKYKQKETSEMKRNNLLEKIEFIKEDAHASKSGELNDAQKNQIAALQDQISKIKIPK